MSGSLVVVAYEMCAPPVQGVSLIDPNIPLITRSTLKRENTPIPIIAMDLLGINTVWALALSASQQGSSGAIVVHNNLSQIAGRHFSRGLSNNQHKRYGVILLS